MVPAVTTLLNSRGYPGRVCAAAVTEDGIPVLAYALTGRSNASRSRRLALLPNGDVEVQDAGEGPRDALRHYKALVHQDRWLVCGNGDQVEPIATALAAGRTELDAWREHTYEPDPPIWTPRIWMVSRNDSNELLIGWVRRSPSGTPERGLLAVESSAPRTGYLLSTYDGSAADVRVSAEPVHFTASYRDADSFGDALWASLDPEVRVAAFTVTSDRTRVIS